MPERKNPPRETQTGDFLTRLCVPDSRRRQMLRKRWRSRCCRCCRCCRCSVQDPTIGQSQQPHPRFVLLGVIQTLLCIQPYTAYCTLCRPWPLMGGQARLKTCVEEKGKSEFGFHSYNTTGQRLTLGRASGTDRQRFRGAIGWLE